MQPTFLFYLDGECIGIGTKAEADELIADGVLPAETELRPASPKRIAEVLS